MAIKDIRYLEFGECEVEITLYDEEPKRKLKRDTHFKVSINGNRYTIQGTKELGKSLSFLILEAVKRSIKNKDGFTEIFGKFRKI